jgi:hypothetical protein
VAKSGSEANREPAEPSIEDLVKEMMASVEPRPSSATRDEEKLSAALTEATVAALSRVMAEASALERVLYVQILVRALADALAPAFAKALAPEIAGVLEHATAADRYRRDARSNGSGHKRH